MSLQSTALWSQSYEVISPVTAAMIGTLSTSMLSNHHSSHYRLWCAFCIWRRRIMGRLVPPLLWSPTKFGRSAHLGCYAGKAKIRTVSPRFPVSKSSWPPVRSGLRAFNYRIILSRKHSLATSSITTSWKLSPRFLLLYIPSSCLSWEEFWLRLSCFRRLEYSWWTVLSSIPIWASIDQLNPAFRLLQASLKANAAGPAEQLWSNYRLLDWATTVEGSCTLWAGLNFRHIMTCRHRLFRKVCLSSSL